ncbi:acyl-CoA synthetase/AMP-acid ligase-like protein II [Amylocarpus encephaloides]|uniref:Acyl-CoA synthetase/AMP-acid ligase-like protein II n=1 Tax=Amylocarpus encephaloides TaxID=45428 RepID=A0A9P8C4Y0_9HELO|nr:acyl-CoA synthetase/AMP-acid ligase-like protein II [Amylocarpus encephaloides]
MVRVSGLGRPGNVFGRCFAGTITKQASGQQTRGLLTRSYAEGPTRPPLLAQTIPEHFSSVVREHGDRWAVIARSQGPAGRLTYKQLDHLSNGLAHGLRERGVRKGDRVAVSLGNTWEFAALTYALFKLGAILVPLNPAFNAAQVISALAHLEAAHLIIGLETNLAYKPPRQNISLLTAIVPDLASSNLEAPSVPSLKNVILVDNSSGRLEEWKDFSAATSFEELLLDRTSKDKEVVPDTPLDKDEIVNIQFTSGTTSSPKAASLTHHGILNNGNSIGSRMGLTPADIVCSPPPLFHCFGSILGYMATATHGSAILWPSEAFNPTLVLESIQAEKATALYGVATMFVAELELLSSGAIPRAGFEHLRTGIAAGSSVPSNLMNKLHEELNLKGLTICYGMTETSPVSFMTFPDDPLRKRIDSVGRLLPHVTAKIVSVTDRSQILPLGEKGELVISGYNVMKGYWGDRTCTDEVMVTDEDGKTWMYTGDEGEMDAEGYVKITGRIKDLIIRGGENIHPLEVENALFRHKYISEASVVGLPDEKYGEVVAAFIVVHNGVQKGLDHAGVGLEEVDAMHRFTPQNRLTKNEVKEWVRSHLSNHLVPKYVFWISSYPKTASGKIQKFRLREMGIQCLQAATRSPVPVVQAEIEAARDLVDSPVPGIQAEPEAAKELEVETRSNLGDK